MTRVDDSQYAEQSGTAASNEVIGQCAECDRLKDTVRRLNRRCQLAEAAANIPAEKWDNRSKHHGRGYIYAEGKRAAFNSPREQEALQRWITGALKSFVDAHGRTLDDGLMFSAVKRIVGAICNGLKSLEVLPDGPAVVTGSGESVQSDHAREGICQTCGQPCVYQGTHP